MERPQTNSYTPDSSSKIVLNRDQYKHEQTQLKEQHNFDLSRKESDNSHMREMEVVKQGWIGHVFGTGDNASKNITASICLLLILGCAVVSLYAYIKNGDKDLASSIWGVIAPIITLSLGYIFGKK